MQTFLAEAEAQAEAVFIKGFHKKVSLKTFPAEAEAEAQAEPFFIKSFIKSFNE